MYQSGERILLTIWIGGMWAIGYIVAPTLFSMVDDRALAGSIAGRLFFIMSLVGIVCSMALLTGQIMQFGKSCLSKTHWQTWLLILMLLIILIGQFIIQPMMNELREAGLVEELKTKFDQLHRFSTILFMINSLAGLALVVFGLKRNDD
ncbi:hypothetical protein MNBD_GAMMA22-2990 [hydrothermal vent metagenome]|uniref:TMEM205-like domain-containing protein n=1 Tax=hydrothermal vent metagenome TaxID=652676 RepID=A0A3B1A495_9ZZZZ